MENHEIEEPWDGLSATHTEDPPEESIPDPLERLHAFVRHYSAENVQISKWAGQEIYSLIEEAREAIKLQTLAVVAAERQLMANRPKPYRALVLRPYCQEAVCRCIRSYEEKA